MNNNPDQLKLYASKAIEFTQMFKDAFDNGFFNKQGIASISILHINGNKSRFILEFYNKDGIIIVDDNFRVLKEVQEITNQVKHLNIVLPTVVISDTQENQMLMIDVKKDFEQEIIEFMLPKKLQIEVEYNELQSEIVANNISHNKKNKI